jgi:delta 1-pyrroline-5-carboxylate dehydrogenase
VADEFTEKFVQKTERLKVGDPLSDDTDIGPVVKAKARRIPGHWSLWEHMAVKYAIVNIEIILLLSSHFLHYLSSKDSKRIHWF